MDELSAHEAIFSLRAMRRLKTDPIPDHVLEYLIEAATMACSPGNTQPWTFLVITDSGQKERIAKIYHQLGTSAIKEGALASGTLDKETEKVYQNAMILVDNLQSAPALILCCLQDIPRLSGIQQSSYYGSIYPAIQNLMLAARARGIGSTMTTLHKAKEQDIKDILSIPQGVETIALIPLGYPQGNWGRPKRKPQPDVTFWNKWGDRREGQTKQS
ncbi:MAG: nitroreductase [Halioglobus sp.]|jgi:nitroreductase